MTKRKIIVCYDVEIDTEGWCEVVREALGTDSSLDDAYEVPSLSLGKIKSGIHDLFARRKQAREEGTWDEGGGLFDDAEILIIDYDLALSSDESPITAETVARLARAFTPCGAIVVLNQYRDIDLDLSLLGHPDSCADLNINSKSLDLKGLWSSTISGSFRPWHWPILPDAAHRQHSRVQQLLEGGLDQPILEFFGFDESVFRHMSRSSKGFLHPNPGSKWSAVTFLDFVSKSGNAIDPKDTDAIVERRTEKTHEAVARVAAARIAKWLERMVLAPQDILVDVPHLVERIPFLLTGDRNQIETWNATVDLTKVNGIDATSISEYAFKQKDWLSRPAFWWPRIDSDEGLTNKLLADTEGNPVDFVFQEDVSKFGRREDSKEFVAAFHSVYDRRYVSAAEDQNFSYAPSVRFAL